MINSDIRYFDVHSHLNFAQFDEDRDEIIKEMKDASYGTMCVGTGLETSQESVDLARSNPHIWATIGVHPTDYQEEFSEAVYANLLDERVVAVGECGLDYYRLTDEEIRSGVKDRQKELFEAQIQFANSHNLSLMLHGRPRAGSMDAYEDMLLILQALGSTAKHPGHVHFFAGDVSVARRFLELGFTIGFDGPITFTDEYDEVIRFIPQDMIQAETDAPFAAPEPRRGRRNSPLYVRYIIERLAEVRGENVEDLSAQLLKNAGRVFNIQLGG